MRKLMDSLLLGLMAGAVGTLVLNLFTYFDMIIQGRAPSSVPEQIAGRLAEKAGVEAIAQHREDETAANRRSAVGALMGYTVGLGLGMAYGGLRSSTRAVPTPLAGVALGFAAMAAADVPATATGTTDPRTWGARGWLSDIVPHIAYGLTTAAIYDTFQKEPQRRLRLPFSSLSMRL
jgi:hypothetical protein